MVVVHASDPCVCVLRARFVNTYIVFVSILPLHEVEFRRKVTEHTRSQQQLLSVHRWRLSSSYCSLALIHIIQ